MISRLDKKKLILTEEVSTIFAASSEISEPLELVKKKLKKNGYLYYFLLRLIGPVFNHPMNQQKLKEMIKKLSNDAIILNVGSGPVRMNEREDILNVDIFPYNEVDILSDGTSLPVRTESVDLVLSIAALEHTQSPQQTISEMYRVTKKGGTALVFVPFMQPFHAAPNDYYRWTQNGIEHLVAPFSVRETWIGGGPTSGMLWVFQEWLAQLLSFGSKNLSQVILLILMIITFPLKWLDLILIYHPMAYKTASGFYVKAIKN